MTVKKDKKPILVKFSEAQTTGDSNLSVYGDWTVVYMLEKAKSGYFKRRAYGTEDDYDLTILLEANPITRQVNSKSVFLIDEYPTALNSKGNYRVKKIFPEYLGTIKIGLEYIEGQNIKRLYFQQDENIYVYELNFDINTQKGYINKNQAHPFSTSTKIWSIEPLDADETENMLEFVSATNVGIVNNYKVFTELTFVEVDNG